MKHRRPDGSLVAGFLESALLGTMLRYQITDEVDQETEERADKGSNRRREAHEQHSVFKFRHSLQKGSSRQFPLRNLYSPF